MIHWIVNHAFIFGPIYLLTLCYALIMKHYKIITASRFLAIYSILLPLLSYLGYSKVGWPIIYKINDILYDIPMGLTGIKGVVEDFIIGLIIFALVALILNYSAGIKGKSIIHTIIYLLVYYITIFMLLIYWQEYYFKNIYQRVWF